MNQPQIVPRYMLKIAVESDGKFKDLNFEFTVPTSQPAPMPQDEIQIPREIAEKDGFKKNSFRVIRRRFILDTLPVGITGIIYLIVE